MKPEVIINKFSSELDGDVPKSSWGETSLFYNPNRMQPKEVEVFSPVREDYLPR